MNLTSPFRPILDVPRILRHGKATRDEIVAFQERRLRQLVRHAYERVPYYRCLFDDARIKPADIRSIADLEIPAIVPVLGRLFAIEANPELKEALIEAVGWGETTDAEKAAVYARALGGDQPVAVRLAATEGLSDLDSKDEALRWLGPLAEDADPEVCAAAQEAIRGFENL